MCIHGADTAVVRATRPVAPCLEKARCIHWHALTMYDFNIALEQRPGKIAPAEETTVDLFFVGRNPPTSGLLKAL